MSENKADPILPCPFCGGKASRLAFNLVCCCDNIDCAGGLVRMPIAKWNTRTAPQPAAPLGGREAIVDELAQDMLGHAFCADWHDDPDKGVREVARIKALFVGKLNGFADAILAAIPQERGVDRAAIIEECAKVADEAKLAAHIHHGVDASIGADIAARRIRALGKETGR